MGSKGPLIIFLIGIGGFVVLGFFANWLLDNNPLLKGQQAFRESVLEEFPVERVVLRQRGDDYELQVWVDPGEFDPAPAPGALPASLARLREHFELGYEARNAPHTLEVTVFPQTGFGCFRGEGFLWRQAFALEEDREAFRTTLTSLLGGNLLMRRSRGGLIVEVEGSPSPETLQTAAERLSGYLGGGWKSIQIRVGRTRHLFDGEGKRRR